MYKKLILLTMVLGLANPIAATEPTAHKGKKVDLRNFIIVLLVGALVVQTILYEKKKKRLKESADKNLLSLRIAGYNALNGMHEMLDKIKTKDLEITNDQQINQIIDDAKKGLR